MSALRSRGWDACRGRLAILLWPWLSSGKGHSSRSSGAGASDGRHLDERSRVVAVVATLALVLAVLWCWSASAVAREASATPTKSRSAGEDIALGYISLAYAAQNGDLAAVKAWLARGVDPNGAGFGVTRHELAAQAATMDAPIVLAAEKGFLEVVKALLEHGAKPDKCCCSCVTALHQAIRNKHPAVVKALLDAGASPTRLFDGRATPLELAIESGDPKIREYIEERLRKTREDHGPKNPAPK